MFYMFKVHFAVVTLLNSKKKNEKKIPHKANTMKTLLSIIAFTDAFYLVSSIRGMLWTYYTCMFIKIIIFINISVSTT